MSDDKEYVICPCCGNILPRGKFCPECGCVLADAEPASEEAFTDYQKNRQEQIKNYTVTPVSGMTMKNIGLTVNSFPGPDPVNIIQSDAAQPEAEAVDDSGLTLIADVCKKTMATVGGDGYDETVLYRNDADGTCQIHSYSKYAYMAKEIHHSYRAKDGAEEAVLSLIDQLGLLEYEGKQGFGLCGGMYVCKFQIDGTMHRVTTDNLGADGPSLIIQVGQMIGSYIGEKITKGNENAE